MGPEATAEFYLRVIGIFQRKFGAKYDSDFPEVIIYNLPLPDVVESISNNKEILNSLAYGIKKLETAGAEIIAIACNTAYCFIDNLKSSSNAEILNVIEEVASQLNNFKKVGLLATSATIKSNLFQEYSKKYGIKILVPTEKEQNTITGVIMRILAGKKLLRDKKKLNKIITNLSDKGAKAIILGCTELPLLVNQKDVKIKLIDTIEILANVSVAKITNLNPPQ